MARARARQPRARGATGDDALLVVLEDERVVLGSALASEAAALTVAERLRPEALVSEAHRRILAAVLSLVGSGLVHLRWNEACGRHEEVRRRGW